MISNELGRNAELVLCKNRYIIHKYNISRRRGNNMTADKNKMDKIKKAHLSRLKELATNFDKEEQQVVLSAIPRVEIEKYLQSGPEDYLREICK